RHHGRDPDTPLYSSGGIRQAGDEGVERRHPRRILVSAAAGSNRLCHSRVFIHSPLSVPPPIHRFARRPPPAFSTPQLWSSCLPTPDGPSPPGSSPTSSAAGGPCFVTRQESCLSPSFMPTATPGTTSRRTSRRTVGDRCCRASTRRSPAISIAIRAFTPRCCMAEV